MPTAAILGPDPNNPLSMAVQQTVVTQQKMPRTADRLEVHSLSILFGISLVVFFFLVVLINFNLEIRAKKTHIFIVSSEQ